MKKPYQGEGFISDLISGWDVIVWKANEDLSRIHFVSNQGPLLTGYSIKQWTVEKDFWAKYINPNHHIQWLKHAKSLPLDENKLRLEHQALSKSGQTLLV